MDKFEASNGITVSVDRGVQFGTDRGWGFYGILGQEWEAMREFFRAERDEELGRWRWPENPDYVVYRDGTSRRIVRESDGKSFSASLHDRKVMTTYLDSWIGAARAYDEAHPERKPWHDAKEGEVWLLTLPNSTQAWFVNGAYFQSAKTLTNIALDDGHITDGRRVWPEEA